MGAALGKWFTPAIGARAAYQGMWLHDSQDAGQKYHAVYADLLWNLLGGKYRRQRTAQTRHSGGGIADYTPVEANRHTRVELHFPPDK